MSNFDTPLQMVTFLLDSFVLVLPVWQSSPPLSAVVKQQHDGNVVPPESNALVPRAPYSQIVRVIYVYTSWLQLVQTDTMK